MVIPKNRAEYRAWLQDTPQSWTVNRFFAENAIYIKNNFKPAERAYLYKKLDSLPAAYRAERDEPEGHRLVRMFDYYVGHTARLYDRALWQAGQQAQHGWAKMEPWLNTFMHEEYGTVLKPATGCIIPRQKAKVKYVENPSEPVKPVPGEGELEIRFNKDGTPRKPYPKDFNYDFLASLPGGVRVNTRTKWTDQMKAYFVHAWYFDSKTEREIGNEMGLTKGQVDGAVGRFLKGEFADVLETLHKTRYAV